MTNALYAEIAAAFTQLSDLFDALSNEAVAASKTEAKKAPAKTNTKDATPAKPAKTSAKKAAPVVEDDEDDDDVFDSQSDVDDFEFTGDGMSESELRAFARSSKIADLRAILKDEHGLEDAEINKLTGKAAVTDRWVELMLDSSEDAGEDAEEDEEDEEAEDEDEDDTPDYESMSLRELRAAAKEAGYSAAQTKGLDKDALIALLNDELEDDEDDEDDTEDSDEDDESDEEEYDPETMSLAELKALAKANGVAVKRGVTKEQLIADLFE